MALAWHSFIMGGPGTGFAALVPYIIEVCFLACLLLTLETCALRRVENDLYLEIMDDGIVGDEKVGTGTAFLAKARQYGADTQQVSLLVVAGREPLPPLSGAGGRGEAAQPGLSQQA